MTDLVEHPISTCIRLSSSLSNPFNYFSGPTITRSYPAILFDMDGTIVDSTNAIVKFWERIGREYNIDPQTILETSHGRRSIDVLQKIDPLRATWDHVQRMEGEVPLLFGEDAVEIKGARSLLAKVEETNVPWAVVTSGTRPLVEGWLKILGLNEPRCMVSAEDVKNGKPDPSCYLLGKERLGIQGMPLVVEDAPVGVRAGKAAGFDVLALATTHKEQELIDAGADWVVRDLESVSLEGIEKELGLTKISFHNTMGVRG